MVRFGLIPEFVGRLPVITTIEELDEAALVRILTEPKNALVKQFSSLLEMEGAKLSFTPEAITAIASKAVQRKSGARGLRAIVENALLDAMYILPSLKDVEEVIVDEAVITEHLQPLLLMKDQRKERLSVEMAS